MPRRRPLHEPRGVLETDARSYLPAIAAGIAIGLFVLAVLLVVDARGRRDGTPAGTPSGRVVLEPVAPVGTVPLGEFGACVQRRLTAAAPQGDETAADMTAARQACLPLLDPPG